MNTSIAMTQSNSSEAATNDPPTNGLVPTLTEPTPQKTSSQAEPFALDAGVFEKNGFYVGDRVRISNHVNIGIIVGFTVDDCILFREEGSLETTRPFKTPFHFCKAIPNENNHAIGVFEMNGLHVGDRIRITGREGVCIIVGFTNDNCVLWRNEGGSSVSEEQFIYCEIPENENDPSEYQQKKTKKRGNGNNVVARGAQKKAKKNKKYKKTHGIRIGDRLRIGGETLLYDHEKKLDGTEATCFDFGGPTGRPLVLLTLDDGSKGSAPFPACRRVTGRRTAQRSTTTTTRSQPLQPLSPPAFARPPTVVSRVDGLGRGRQAILPAWMNDASFRDATKPAPTNDSTGTFQSAPTFDLPNDEEFITIDRNGDTSL